MSINLYLLGWPLLSSAPKGLKLYLMNLSKASSVGRCKNWNQKFVRVGNSLLYKPINEAYVTFFLYTEARGEIKVSSLHGIVIAPMGWSYPNFSSVRLIKSWNKGWFNYEMGITYRLAYLGPPQHRLKKVFRNVQGLWRWTETRCLKFLTKKTNNVNFNWILSL